MKNMCSIRRKRKFKRALKDVFGFDNYLALQEEASLNVFDANRDVFISGYGKSLCYQLPVLIKDNVFIIVISSSIVYIKRYQEYFKAKNIKTNYLISNTSRKNRMAIETDILSKKSTLKILFITPLKYESGYFKTLLKQIDKHRLFYIVVDQAENIIAQQDNIRRPYENLDLKILKVPIVAISGTANSQAQNDIITKFNLLNPKIYAMPESRFNVYHDTWYINTLLNPIVHLREFIEKCFLSPDNNMNSVEKDTWGVIVCKDWEAAISIAKYLSFIGISALPYTSSAKNKQLKNFKNIKVITVCAQVDILAVTNRLVQIIARKLVRFVVYWCVFPDIKKHCYFMFQGIHYGMSYCRIYCKLEDLIYKNAQSFNYDDESSSDASSFHSHDESSSEIKTSLMQIECRHKVYSKYCNNTSSACEYYCDVCKDRKKVEEKMDTLLQFAGNEYLGKKLREAFELSINSGQICHDNLQYECLKETVPCQYHTKNIESKATRKCNDDHSSLDTRIQNIEKNNDKLYQKSQSSSKLSKTRVSRGYQTMSTEREATEKRNDNQPTLDTDIQCLEKNNNQNKKSQELSKSSKKTITSRYETINIENEATKGINDNHSRLDASIQCIEENNDKLDKKSKALLALKEIYKNLYGIKEATSTSKLAPTQSFNSVNQNTESVKKSKKSNNRNRESETKTIEVITIDDDTNEKEGFVLNEIFHFKENVPNSDNNNDDDDIIFIKESKKRRISQDSISKRKKRPN